MQNLIDKMFIKRFCLPKDINIENDEFNVCNCDNYNHISCIIKGKDH